MLAMLLPEPLHDHCNHPELLITIQMVADGCIAFTLGPCSPDTGSSRQCQIFFMQQHQGRGMPDRQDYPTSISIGLRFVGQRLRAGPWLTGCSMLALPPRSCIDSTGTRCLCTARHQWEMPSQNWARGRCLLSPAKHCLPCSKRLPSTEAMLGMHEWQFCSGQVLH